MDERISMWMRGYRIQNVIYCTVLEFLNSTDFFFLSILTIIMHHMNQHRKVKTVKTLNWF